ncbi:MAG: hypothetical protein ACJA2S_004878 [Cyclobacteriaceae bacterium]|jgi:hypothetical protein
MANKLTPKNIRIVDQNLILMAENEDGSLKLIQPNDVADNGATIS